MSPGDEYSEANYQESQADPEEDDGEEELRDIIAIAIDHYANDNDKPLRCRTFAEVGVLSNDVGLVIRIGDAEFQVSIVRSR